MGVPINSCRTIILLAFCFFQVMEHPQTVGLNKVLGSNIQLGNACTNKLDQSKIISRWMNLQESVNVLFDSKTATG